MNETCLLFEHQQIVVRVNSLLGESYVAPRQDLNHLGQVHSAPDLALRSLSSHIVFPQVGRIV